MTAQVDSGAEPRPALSRDRVLRSAISIADREGLEALSMRKLGKTMQVEAMSLYNHVANKEDLIDGIVDMVFGEIELPPDCGEWKESLRRRAISVYEALRRHPWAIALMQSRVKPGPATLRHHDSVIGCLRTAGFTIGMAAHAVSVMDGYIYGFALQQRNLPLQSSGEVAAVAENILQALPADEYPHLSEMINEHALKPGYDYASKFEFGLDLILDGLARLKNDA